MNSEMAYMPDVVNFLVLMPCFVFTWQKGERKHKHKYMQNKRKHFDPCAHACVYTYTKAVFTVK